VESIDLRSFPFDTGEMKGRYAPHADCRDRYPWTLDAAAMEQFRAADFPEAASSTLAQADVHKAVGQA
jgi:hypothetical protein